MLSRVADSIYWLNRYIERADSYARFIDVNLNLTLDLPPGMAEQWAPLIYATGDNQLFDELYGEATKENVLRFLIAEKRNPSSVRNCLYLARENARSVRERLSLEIWEHINDFYIQVREATRSLDEFLADPTAFCTMVKQHNHMFLGLFDNTLTHGEAWRFGQLGRQIERAEKTTRMLDVKYFILLPRVDDIGNSFDLLQWSSVLKSASAYEMYTRIYETVNPASIVEFLVLHREFPRSLRFCLIAAENNLRSITGYWPEDGRRGYSNPAEKRLGLLRSELDYTDMNDVFRVGLHEYLDATQLKLNDIGEALYETFFRTEPESSAETHEADASDVGSQSQSQSLPGAAESGQSQSQGGVDRG